MLNFADKLIDHINKKQNPSIVGLDPRIERIPSFIKNEMLDKYGNSIKAVAKSFIKFNYGIINAVSDIVPAVKPQIAFYEKYGFEGVKCFQETVKYAKSKGLIVVEDAKRNDIGTTASAYSSGHIGKVNKCKGDEVPMFDVDAITINAYLGSDGVKPFIEDIKKYGKGCFILVKTSNISSGELQDKKLIDNLKLSEHVARYVNEWGKDTIGDRGYSSIGAVVGATFSTQVKSLREIMKRSIFLSPGYGAQGASAKDIIPLFNEDGYGALISSSRNIVFAYETSNEYSDDDYIESAHQSALLMKNELNDALKEKNILPW